MTLSALEKHGARGRNYGAEEGTSLRIANAVSGSDHRQDTIGESLIDHIVEGDLDTTFCPFVSLLESRPWTDDLPVPKLILMTDTPARPLLVISLTAHWKPCMITEVGEDCHRLASLVNGSSIYVRPFQRP